MESMLSNELPAKTEDSIPQANNNNDSSKDSGENFQKFIYKLFEENGVLNDLRTYLRSHIVDVIKNAQTGDPPACQKHFTQRLELTYQALNILIVEYLLCLEFSYSLSVFVSEIPLANMVFGFAQTLLQNADIDHLKLRFSDGDVWSILNYLGIKCDSMHASNIVDTYRNEGKSPLLLCILKCMPLYHKETISAEQVRKSVNTSSESLPSITDSSDTIDKTRYPKNNGSCQDKCKHYVFCKTCQAKLSKIKEKYKRKKKTLCKNIKNTAMNPLIGDNLMKNIGALEKALIDEMFQQLKAVYEAEIEMVKKEEEKKIKRSLASHAMLLQKHQDELDEAFKVREEELKHSVQQKKKFLWGLAKALREQHTQMSRAMNAVRNETQRLSAKEDSLKTQLIEAESILRRRGEEMRSQITNELTILEKHLESMKRERDSIHKERTEFENYKSECDSKLSINNDMKSHYDLVKNELGILKKYLESTKLEPKCVIERSTLTELCDVTSKINIILNNEQDADRNLVKSDSEDRVSRAPNQVVNNLKKQKNVNFSNSHLDVIYQDGINSDRSRSPMSSHVGDVRDAQHDGQTLDMNVRQLREENDRLKTFARQQRQHIDDLSRQQARLQSELTAAYLNADCTPNRPRTAPSVIPQSNIFAERLSTSASANCFGWRKGAGEELSTLCNAQPRILLPGDDLPFVGVLRDRQTDYRRRMISQWRSLRRRVSPAGVARARPLRAATRRARDDAVRNKEAHAHAGPTISTPDPTHVSEEESIRETSEAYIMQPQHSFNGNIQSSHTAVSMEVKSTRDKSPKSVLREAKQKLRNKENTIRNVPREASREKSPNSVLREAKLRLRKLEIEAEAVEKSYLDFKKRQTERKEGRNYTYREDNIDQDVKLDTKHRSVRKLDENHRFETGFHPNYITMEQQQSIRNDFEKYIRNYQTKFNITETPAALFAVEKSRPIPETFSKLGKRNEDIKVRNNYLETPLSEFRKLYHSQKSSIPFRTIENVRADYPKAEKDETPRNRENIAQNEQELSRHAYTEKVDRPRINENDPRDDQELSKTVYPDYDDFNGEKTVNVEKISTSVYSEINPERHNENTSNELEMYDRGNNLITEADNETLIKNKQAELEILKDNLSKMYNLQDQSKIEPKPTIELVCSSLSNEIKEETGENNLRIEVESVSETNKLKITESQPQELLLTVQSSVEARDVSVSE